MKVWMYYAYPKDIFPNDEDAQSAANEYGSDAEALYAMTDKKEFAKIFRKTRNMEIFHESILDIDKEEWEILLSDNRDAYLEYRPILTRKSVKDVSYPEEYCKTNILMTFMEFVDVDDHADLETITMTGFSERLSPLGILGIPLLRKLFKLGYWDLLAIARDADYRIVPEICAWTETDDKLIEMVEEIHHVLKIDQLEYFITYYGHTLAD